MKSDSRQNFLERKLLIPIKGSLSRLIQQELRAKALPKSMKHKAQIVMEKTNLKNGIAYEGQRSSIED